MNAETMASVGMVAVIYALIFFNYYKAVSGAPRDKKTARRRSDQYLKMREHLRTRVRARIEGKLSCQ